MILSTCDQCGQTDDHPKVISFGGGNHHHDCLPAVQKAEMISVSPNVALIIAQAESGVTGDALRAFIVALPPESA
jgi:hypothetical protein